MPPWEYLPLNLFHAARAGSLARSGGPSFTRWVSSAIPFRAPEPLRTIPPSPALSTARIVPVPTSTELKVASLMTGSGSWLVSLAGTSTL